MSEDTEKRGPGRPAKPRLVEVVAMRPYVPTGFEEDGEFVEQSHEIKIKVPAGTVLKLPRDEANKGLKNGVLGTTDNTLGA